MYEDSQRLILNSMRTELEYTFPISLFYVFRDPHFKSRSSVLGLRVVLR